MIKPSCINFLLKKCRLVRTDRNGPATDGQHSSVSPCTHKMPTLWTLLLRPTAACILLGFFAVQTSGMSCQICLLDVKNRIIIFCPGYLVINEPAAQREWANNAPNLVSWSKGLLDGIHGFDVEMARMSTDGLTLVARNGQSYSYSGWSMD